MTSQAKATTREVRRLQTRERVLGAALAEFTRSGMTGADVNAIAAAAGVAHGTFFFHFPSKEHVLYQLQHREEARMAADFERFLEGAHDLPAALTEISGIIQGLEQTAYCIVVLHHAVDVFAVAMGVTAAMIRTDMRT